MKRNDNLVEIRGLYKSFSGVYVLTDVDFDLREGEVHALVGENGAGKSTFIKILSGAYERDRGSVKVSGREVQYLNPQIAQELGVVTIYQDRNLVPYLSVAENILIADEPRGKLGFIQWKRLYRRVGEICRILNLPLRPRDIVADLSAAQQQMVEIAKALYKNAKVVVMDEPTASLTSVEIAHLFDLIKHLKKQAVSVIYISHRLDEIFAVAERVTVLRDGRKVGTFEMGSIDREALVKAMVGEELRFTRIGEIKEKGALLQVEGLSKKGQFEKVSITLRKGEIIGVAGMVGSGRTEIVRALAGLETVDEGRILFRGEDITRKRFGEFIRMGICLLPEERDLRGLISSMSVAANITLASLGKISNGPFLRLLHEKKVASSYVEALNIVTRGVQQEVQFLSGGNRQKVMLAKWLCMGMELFLMDEPTQGVDVGAREEIHRIMMKSVEDGKAIIMVTSDLDELMNMSHRIMVMNKGRVTAWFTTSETTQEEVLSFAIGKTER
jgi:ABC-type sugar transport system ATPase subunit